MGFTVISFSYSCGVLIPDGNIHSHTLSLPSSSLLPPFSLTFSLACLPSFPPAISSASFLYSLPLSLSLPFPAPSLLLQPRSPCLPFPSLLLPPYLLACFPYLPSYRFSLLSPSFTLSLLFSIISHPHTLPASLFLPSFPLPTFYLLSLTYLLSSLSFSFTLSLSPTFLCP